MYGPWREGIDHVIPPNSEVERVWFTQLTHVCCLLPRSDEEENNLFYSFLIPSLGKSNQKFLIDQVKWYRFS